MKSPDPHIISRPLTGKEAEENNKRIRELIGEMSASAKATGLTEEKLQQIIDGSGSETKDRD